VVLAELGRVQPHVVEVEPVPEGQVRAAPAERLTRLLGSWVIPGFSATVSDVERPFPSFTVPFDPFAEAFDT
jgi:hypothetical protein